MRNVSDKFVEKIKTFFSFSIFFFKNRDIYEIMWKYTVEWSRPLMTIWHMPIACWITKAADTHSEYVKLVAVPMQQWLHEIASVLHYTHIECLSPFCRKQLTPK